MSRVQHLLAADEVAEEGHRCGSYIAVCGEVIVPGQQRCEGDPRYRPDCAREALQWSASG